jgi:hypothetical protein
MDKEKDFSRIAMQGDVGELFQICSSVEKVTRQCLEVEKYRELLEPELLMVLYRFLKDLEAALLELDSVSLRLQAPEEISSEEECALAKRIKKVCQKIIPQMEACEKMTEKVNQYWLALVGEQFVTIEEIARLTKENLAKLRSGANFVHSFHPDEIIKINQHDRRLDEIVAGLEKIRATVLCPENKKFSEMAAIQDILLIVGAEALQNELNEIALFSLEKLRELRERNSIFPDFIKRFYSRFFQRKEA